MNYTHDKCYRNTADRNVQDSDNFYKSLYEGLGVDNVWLYVLSGGIGYRYYKAISKKMLWRFAITIYSTRGSISTRLMDSPSFVVCFLIDSRRLTV